VAYKEGLMFSNECQERHDMRVVILDSADLVAARAAEQIKTCLSENPRAVLGLATGGTPLGTYRELVRLHKRGEISFSNCTTFNLDEYVGLPKEHPESYYSFMHQNLFSQADFNVANCYLPDGNRPDYEVLCEEYEQKIADSGGIDLQLLGIGSDGHIAFNEPGSSLASRTRLKALTQQTREDNARFFNSMDEVPELAITMGIGTILEAKKILLLATGEGKASAVRAFIEGPLTSQIPASALQLHPHVTVLLDNAAAGWLVRRNYYEHVESIQRRLESDSARLHD
jgi:glucosamine-6-phosphate deaminase